MLDLKLIDEGEQLSSEKRQELLIMADWTYQSLRELLFARSFTNCYNSTKDEKISLEELEENIFNEKEYLGEMIQILHEQENLNEDAFIEECEKIIEKC